jgi:uncharacterized protein YjbI with pentapeptide repeats
MPLDDALTGEIWARLVSGTALDDLGLPRKEGRIDLSGLTVPEPSAPRRLPLQGARVSNWGHLVEVRGGRWTGLDLSNARLEELRIFDTRIEDCVLDGARCDSWRMWSTEVLRTSLRRACLRNASLGAANAGKRNVFRDVDFSGADLRGTGHGCALMECCRFVNSKLDHVEFQGTVFVDVVFEGTLREVMFGRRWWPPEYQSFPPNEMKRVSFKKAKFRLVEFRDLELDEVEWPDDPDHFVLTDYRDVLARMSQSGIRELAALSQVLLEGASPNQRAVVVSRRDLLEFTGERGVEEFLALLKR